MKSGSALFCVGSHRSCVVDRSASAATFAPQRTVRL